MVVGTARNELAASLEKSVGKRLAVGNDLRAVLLELGLERLTEADSLRSDGVHERTALCTGENRLVDLLRELLAAEDQTASGTSESLVSGGGDEFAVGYGVGMNARGNKTRDVRHIDHQIGADSIGDLSELGEINDSGIGGRTRDDQLGLAFLGKLHDLVIVDSVCHAVNAVGYEVEVLARDIDG